MNKLLYTLAGGAALAASCAPGQKNARTGGPPNVVISLADDLKQHDGIDADPQEIFELMMEFDRQDAEE